LRKSGAWIFLVASGFVLLRPLTSPASDPAPYSIADFEGPDALQSWRFPGGPGHVGFACLPGGKPDLTEH
jgi:hypothetical protein